MKSFPIVIETPANSNIKYKYDPEAGVYRVKKALPLGMVFPYAFGFIKGTKGEDGDPVDAMIISSEEFITGCHIEARLIGAMLAEQTEKGKKTRNDRYFFIPGEDLLLQHITEFRDFGKTHNEQLSDFFINYNKASGKIFRPLRIVNKASALVSLNKLFQPK